MPNRALAAGIARVLAPAALIGLSLAAGPASADPVRLREGMGGVDDMGATKCDYYAYIHPNGPSGFDQAVLYWFQGYVNARSGKALNAFLAEVPNGNRWTFERIGRHVLDYCTANPDRTVADGVMDLWSRVVSGG
ncbi:MAG: hypothetical protein JNM50_01250 [Chromatiales bacterium]|jgi:hypothetical protein|nr:hypothetical protein [Chromatiales bacterium]